MAVDLFVNFERESNNPLFYRSISSTPFTCNVKLSDIEQTDEDFQLYLYNNFVAKIVQSGSPTLSTFNLLTGNNLSFDRQIPAVSSIQVLVYSPDDTEFSSPLETYSLSAKFVNSFPQASFIAYPAIVINEKAKSRTVLNSTNYFQSSGVYFYGEGHTETITLSTKSYNGFVINWSVGNYLDQINEPSKIEIVSVNSTTSTVELTSTLSQNEKYPINLRLTNNDFPLSGPIIYYNDETGQPSFYSFFSSSLTPTNEHNSQASKYNQSIHIRPYPFVSQYSFESPFVADVISLPPDGTNKPFTTKTTFKGTSAFFDQELFSTKWNLKTEVDSFETTSNWNYTTPELQKTVYRFPLSYDTDSNELTPIFKIPAELYTTVQLTLSAKKQIQIKMAPNDWLPNTQLETFTDEIDVSPIPTFKFYCPTYFNLTDFPVELRILDDGLDSNYQLNNLTLKTDSQTIVLSSKEQYKNSNIYLSFNKTGTKSLTSIAVIQNGESSLSFTQTFSNIVEILNTLDNLVEDKSFYSSTQTPFVPLLSSCPVISPNEWVTTNNINSILKDMYDFVEQMKKNLFRYQPTSFLYGWLGDDKYNWSDLECTSQTASQLQWAQNVISEGNINNENGFPLFWTQQECNEKVTDPSCLQKYCLEWKWGKRRKRASKIFTTWKDTKKENTFAKKWSYEPCEIDSQKIDCFKGRWHISTIDSQYFPIPFCSTSNECEIRDCVTFSNGNLLFGHPTELHLYNDQYIPTLLARRGNVDEIFNFANIKSIGINSNEQIYVLDSFLPRVASYNVINNEIVNANAWGRFGLAGDAYGFNKPNHIHIDKGDRVWVTDSGNACIKCYTSTGKHLATFKNDEWQNFNLIGLCVDSESKLHLLTDTKVLVYSFNIQQSTITKSFEYFFPEEIFPVNIATSYNRETIYVTHNTGLIKYFQTGAFYEEVLKKIICANGKQLDNFKSVVQSNKRTLFVCVDDKLLMIPDRMKIDTTFLNEFSELKLYWDFEKIQIDKEEYIQPWVYLKAFHRLWDNIELIRGLVPYDSSKNQSYLTPVFKKNDLTIGQNEIVTNAAINRLISQTWSNLATLRAFF